MNEFSGKTVMVTGATGLIGSHIVDVLLEQGDVRVIAVGRKMEKLHRCFQNALENKNLVCLAHNVGEPFAAPMETIHYLFHAASPMDPGTIQTAPVDVLRPNLSGTIHCLELLQEQKARTGISGRAVIFSSVTVYANPSEEERTVTEEDTALTEKPEAIRAPYSQSKRFSEVISHAYHRQYGVDVVIGRFSTVYGFCRFFPDTAFFEFIQKAAAGENLTVSRRGLPRRDNIYVDDAVNGILLIARRGEAGKAYNISSNGARGNFASVDEIAVNIAQIANEQLHHPKDKLVQVLFREDAQNRMPGLLLHNGKLRALGWEVQTSLSQGIAKTIEEYIAFCQSDSNT